MSKNVHAHIVKIYITFGDVGVGDDVKGSKSDNDSSDNISSISSMLILVRISLEDALRERLFFSFDWCLPVHTDAL